MTPRTIPCIVVAAALLATACGDSDETTATVNPATTATTVTTATTQPPATTTAPTTTDAATAETDRIIQAWIDGWLADDPDAVVVLYTEDGIYADAAYPFEYPVDYLVRTHMSSHTYTAADPLNITYMESGAIVDWLWEGTSNGSPFSMNATTTFETADGLIVESTDSFVRCEAPWTEPCES